MKIFTAYRPLVHTHGRHDENQANAPDQPQFEGVVFSDGKVAQRWLTAARSVAIWDCLEDMMKIHGHPEYGTYIVWGELK